MKTHSNENHIIVIYVLNDLLDCMIKRHELLHQGVKNFKCQGYLNDGVTSWDVGKLLLVVML